MPAAYEIGQKVLIKPVSEQGLSVRAATLQQYVGQTGIIIDYHWIEPPTGEVFYLYTVRIDNSDNEIVLYEDELTHI